ncbi:hypothetical protein N7499_002107 [Penicillium canescens]|uniref:Uncharacterized protein n=1 Tax=Penicillium canescens TaxID=5083 RepID=A0AAD6I6R1_PENCN|nr:uncharacterized protein N7446_009648 [Penicillium canescens]KAJ6002028.1 hypothetical protein N7522_007255 [Penicillium canescens]KAJ6034891.1 hypothetical protein N7460_009066 [Penicillium canescens]KAJ6046554.1 hypothetical protein N7444_007808 [Penicillium canescens]KAJ6053636.1 hypothetical protein N7446_009648 [Penicillium canescens]KAJ6097733.1 hypothetical protein N7499_002107 [Penicillium canescens]
MSLQAHNDKLIHNPASPTPTPTMQPTSSTPSKSNNGWLRSVLASIGNLFQGPNSHFESESESDAVSGWVGMRRGGRCRSVGEAH